MTLSISGLGLGSGGQPMQAQEQGSWRSYAEHRKPRAVAGVRTDICQKLATYTAQTKPHLPILVLPVVPGLCLLFKQLTPPCPTGMPLAVTIRCPETIKVGTN